MESLSKLIFLSTFDVHIETKIFELKQLTKSINFDENSIKLVQKVTYRNWMKATD